MDWFFLASQILAKKRQETVEVTAPKGIFEGFEEVECSLSPLEAVVMAAVLEIASLQLYILDVGACSSAPDRSNVFARQEIIRVIEETRNEIMKTGSFTVLYEKTKQEAEKRNTEKLLIKWANENQERIQDLKNKLKGQEMGKIKEMNEKQETIALLKDTIHEEITKNEVKLRYIEKWETARQGQNKIRCQNAESECEKKLEQITNKFNNEIRVHDEICTFLALEVKVLLEELQNWKERYEKEMKRRTEKIKMLEVKRKEQQILHHNLLELYEDHQREINNYLELKEQLRLEKERQKYVNEMATKIQAWWRGTMVRRGLGPFKRKKKPGKDKKK